MIGSRPDKLEVALQRAVADGALGVASGTRQQLPDQSVQLAVRIVDTTGIAGKLEQWRSDDSTERHAGGRPSAIPDRAIVALYVMLAIESTPLFASNIATAIEHRLSKEALESLGIKQHPSDSNAWYDRAWRATHRLLKVIDPYPAPRHRRLTPEEFAAVVEQRDAKACGEKQQRLDWLANALIEATWQMLPRETRRRWKGNVCIDATPVRAFSRGFSKRSPSTVEHDAAWYVREGDHRDAGDHQGKIYKKALFGWEATIAIAATNDPSHPVTFPLLATGIAFDKPGHSVAENAMTVFTSMHARKHPVGIAVSDRAYWPGSAITKLQLPMRALGYKNVNDYRENQLGKAANHGGGIQVEGRWYCPSMPTELIDATIDFRTKKSIDEATWKARINARERYALHAKEASDPDGHQVLRCPAIGPSATAACPLKPESLRGNTLVQRVRITTTPAHPDRICKQTSLSFPPTVGAKLRQDIAFGTDEWHAMYATARNTIEGFNGYVKDGPYEALGNPTRRRLRGRTAQHFLTALLVMAANIRKVRTFFNNETASSQTLRPRRNRRRETLTDYLPVSSRPPPDAKMPDAA